MAAFLLWPLAALAHAHHALTRLHTAITRRTSR